MAYKPKILTVSEGGSGLNSATAYSVICGGTSSTAAFQSVASVGTSNQALISNGSGALPTFQDLPSGLAVYADGIDGPQTFDGSSVVLGITPSSSIYTLNRDIYLASSTINNGVTIITNGFRIFCSGTLTNNGTIKWNGNPGTNTGTQGAALNNTNSSFNTSLTLAMAGGAGATGTGGNAGAQNGATSMGGAGGAGGTGGNAGGSAGTIGTAATTSPPLRFFPGILGGGLKGGGTGYSIFGGAGGGGGGGDGSNVGGGGGGGGGVVIVFSYKISGTGNIQALGGSGGNGSVGATNAGGGGGGGGGVVVVVSKSVLSNAISGQTISAAGGSQGSGTGTGAAGSPGSNGTTLIYYM
jgi:hypothetical protein